MRFPIGLVAAMVLQAASVAAAAAPMVFTTVDGHKLDLGDYRGRWVLVNYFATWCASCVTETPELSKLAKDNKGLAVIGVTDETVSPEKLQAFYDKSRAAYPTYQVSKASLPATLPDTFFGLNSRPISYLLRPDGSVAKRFVGTVPINAVEAIIASSRTRTKSPQP